MTVKQTAVIMDILKAAYPNFYMNQTEKERFNVVELWATMFSDDDLQIVAAAVKAFIATDNKGYPPVIGVIKNKIAELKTPDNTELTEYEAWNKVKKAIRNGIYGASEEFAELPPVIQNLVGSPNQINEWAKMTSETVETVIGSNFMRSYRTKTEHNRTESMLPPDVKKFVSELSARIDLDPRSKASRLVEGGGTREHELPL